MSNHTSCKLILFVDGNSTRNDTGIFISKKQTNKKKKSHYVQKNESEISQKEEYGWHPQNPSQNYKKTTDVTSTLPV